MRECWFVFHLQFHFTFALNMAHFLLFYQVLCSSDENKICSMCRYLFLACNIYMFMHCQSIVKTKNMLQKTTWKSHIPHLKVNAIFAVTLSMLGNFSCFCCCCLLTFSKFDFSKKSFRNTIGVSNCFDPNQDQRSGPKRTDLGPKYLQKLAASKERFFLNLALH